MFHPSMISLAQAEGSGMTPVGIAVGLGGLVVGLGVMFIVAKYFNLWIQCKTTGAAVSMFDLIGMSLRKVDQAVIVRAKVMAVQAGLTDRDVSTKALEAHYLAGGNVPNVVRALIVAHRAEIPLVYKRAVAIDLAGRDVLEAVQTSVYPRVIDCPDPAKGTDTLYGVAKNGIQVRAKARVTVRTNLEQLIGGATQETVIARVGEGIVSAIGSAATHGEVFESPNNISRAVLAKGLDSQTAFEIVSLDIADVDVGDNIGARLQADQAEADMRRFRAEAEARRAQAVARSQEMRALVEENRAKIVLAEAEVPMALAHAFRQGHLLHPGRSTPLRADHPRIPA